MIKNEKLLKDADPRLVKILTKVGKKYNITILEVLRLLKRQKELKEKGFTKTLKSKHLADPITKKSKAVDVAPDPIPKNWGKIPLHLIKTKEDRDFMMFQIKELVRFYHLLGYIKAMADELGIDIKQGGDWDGDNEFNDQNFDDLPHLQLKK